MAEDDHNDDNDDDDGDDGKKPPGEDLVPRKEVNRIAGREKRQGNRQGRLDLIEELLGEGKSESDLKKLIEKATSGSKEESQAIKDAQAERDAAREELARTKELGSKRDLSDKIYDELVEAGLKPKAARRAVKLVDLDDPKAGDDEVVGAVDDLRQEMPELFKASETSTEGEGEQGGDGSSGGSSGGRTGNPPPRSDVGKPPGGKRKGEPTSMDKARARLVKDEPHMFNPDGTRRDQPSRSGQPLTYERT